MADGQAYRSTCGTNTTEGENARDRIGTGPAPLAFTGIGGRAIMGRLNADLPARRTPEER